MPATSKSRTPSTAQQPSRRENPRTLRKVSSPRRQPKFTSVSFCHVAPSSCCHAAAGIWLHSHKLSSWPRGQVVHPAEQAKALSAKTNITKSVSKDWRPRPSAPGSGRGRRGARPQPRCLWTCFRSTFRAGTPRHENVKNWRLLAAKSTQNLCTPRTPELPSEALVEAHRRELRPRRPVHELLPRRSRDFAAAAHEEPLARADIGLVLPPPSNTREGKSSRHHSKGTCEDGGQRHRAFEPATSATS